MARSSTQQHPYRRRRGPRRAAGLLLVLILIQSCETATTAPATPPRDPVGTPFTSVVLDTSNPATARYGFTDVDADPSRLGSLTGSQKALVWLGGYDNTACQMTWSDDEIRQVFSQYALAASPRITGYFLADEPNANSNCPTASEQVKARSQLVRSLDPNTDHFTFADIDDPLQFASFRDSADVLGTDPYPCKVNTPCDWSQIPRYIAHLRSAHITHYMGVLQAFSGDGWRWPTAAELRQMITQWQQSDWCGEVTFAWTYENLQLSDHPDLLAVIQQLNTQPQVTQRC